MTGIEWLTYDVFAGRVGDTFTMDLGAGRTQPVVLAEATQSSEAGGRGPDGQSRLQFSLVFHGPATPTLPQSIYRLVHEELGELDLFLVPIGPDADAMRYEAAFA